jgi:hypothetical protein
MYKIFILIILSILFQFTLLKRTAEQESDDARF